MDLRTAAFVDRAALLALLALLAALCPGCAVGIDDPMVFAVGADAGRDARRADATRSAPDTATARELDAARTREDAAPTPDAAATPVPDAASVATPGEPDAGAVSLSCAAGQMPCDGRCVNPRNDRSNCGVCGTRCGVGMDCCNGICLLIGTAEACTCGRSCVRGETCCSGRCIDITSNNDHCGACGARCRSRERCQQNRCR